MVYGKYTQILNRNIDTLVKRRTASFSNDTSMQTQEKTFVIKPLDKCHNKEMCWQYSTEIKMKGSKQDNISVTVIVLNVSKKYTWLDQSSSH